jgi:hypothetical protein
MDFSACFQIEKAVEFEPVSRDYCDCGWDISDTPNASCGYCVLGVLLEHEDANAQD